MNPIQVDDIAPIVYGKTSVDCDQMKKPVNELNFSWSIYTDL